MSSIAAGPRAASRMTATERRATACLAGVSGLRMLGLFIVLPVLALHAESLPGCHDPAMIGIAIGAYGLAPALLQIPFGWASARVG
ncbi:MAG TPA: MFS transporter, partial [Casimicrobiaceae bacterium]|nr:MFS transporter [Casimicrobiaceae bacterium]